MNLDTSVAPELAILAGQFTPAAYGAGAAWAGTATTSSIDTSGAQGAVSGTGAVGETLAGEPGRRLLGGPGPGSPATVGYLAACLRLLVADPQSWWDLVRFDPDRAVQIPVTTPEQGCEAWLLVLPPGHRGDEVERGPGWDVACLVAGAVAEQDNPADGAPVRAWSPGRTRVRGSHHQRRMINTGAGYAVSLHARSLPTALPFRPRPRYPPADAPCYPSTRPRHPTSPGRATPPAPTRAG